MVGTGLDCTVRSRFRRKAGMLSGKAPCGGEQRLILRARCTVDGDIVPIIARCKAVQDVCGISNGSVTTSPAALRIENASC